MKTRAWVWHIVRTRNIFYSIFLRNFYALTWNVVHGESLRSKLESWQQKITYFFLSPFRLSQKEKEWQIFALQKEWMNKIQKGEYAGTSVACIYDTFLWQVPLNFLQCKKVHQLFLSDLLFDEIANSRGENTSPRDFPRFVCNASCFHFKMHSEKIESHLIFYVIYLV